MRVNLQKRRAILTQKRKKRVRAKVSGCELKPRITVFRSNKYFYAQAIDDTNGLTIASANNLKNKVNTTVENVKEVAQVLSEGLKAKNVTEVVFDRNGYKYHGIIASFADALRETGIKF